MLKDKLKQNNNEGEKKEFFQRTKKLFSEYCSLHFIKKSPILSLSPRVIKDEYINEYLKKLHAAIKSKDIYNISVTGNYGTGKSSIIKTYLNKYHISEKNYIIINIASYFDYEETINSNLTSESGEENSVISLPTKQEEANKQISTVPKDKSEEAQKDIQEKYQSRKLDKNEIKLVDNIEAAILRQILFRNSAEELKESKIKRVSSKIRQKIDIFTILYSFYFILLFVLVELCESNTNLTELLYIFPKYSSLVSNIIIIILCIIFLFSIGNIIYLLVSSCYYGIKSIKLNFKSNELALSSKEELTFSKNLREIILFFSHNKKYRLVIFEDIDRFPEDATLKLIEELKQLNNIINHSKPHSPKKTFIYSFKDSIFSNIEDKNKFYDYNLSVMPTSTFYNSKEVLNNLLKEANVEVQPNDQLKDILTDYITDVRTYISIINDYDLFCKVLNNRSDDNDLNINTNKIFAMAILKNIEFKQYEEILKHDNFLDQKFKIIDEKREEKQKELEDKIEEYKIELNKEYKNNLPKIFTLKEFFWNNCVTKKAGSLGKLFGDKKSYTREDFLDSNFDINLLRDDKLELRNEEMEIYPFDKEREEFIKDYDEIAKKENEAQQNMEITSKELEEIESLSDGKIYEKYYLKQGNKNEEDKENSENQEQNEKENAAANTDKYTNMDIIDNLIVNEYLESDYVDYITSPSSGLTSSESKFIFNVKHHSYNPSAKIIHPDKILEQLNNYLDTPFILNYDMLEYIKDKESLEQIAILFKKTSKEKQSFLKSLKLKKPQAYENLISKILSLKIDLWEQTKGLEEDSNYQEMIFESILCEKNGFKIVRDSDSFIAYSNEFFNKNRTFTIERVLLNKNAETNINQYMKFKIRIEDISDYSPEIIIKITNLKIYKYNDNNLKEILPFVPDDLSTKAFVTTTNGRDFLQSIQENFQIFYDEYYNSHENMKINNPDIIKKVLNSSIELSAKERIYKRETFKIDINNIDKDLYEVAMKNNRIIASWGTVLTLDRKISHTVIIDWIIKNKDQLLTKHSIENNYSPTQIYYIKKVIIKLLEENVKSNEAENIYNIIHAKKPEYKITNIGELNVSDKTLKQLCKWDFLEYKKPTFQRLINSDKEYAKLYLVNWLKKENSFSIYTKIKAIPGATELLLKINVISNEDKVKIIINEERSQDETEELLKISFPSNKPITIKYKNKKDKSLFYNEKYSSLFKNYKENNDEKTITFTIK